MRRPLEILPVLFAVFVLTPVAVGEVYHPLHIGTQWHYANDNGQLEDMSITGEREVLGVVTAVRHEVIYDGRIPPQVLDNFWTSNAEGDLLLHGAVNYTETLALAYSPPILMVDGPLFAGKSWVTEQIQIFDLDGTPMDTDPFDYPLAVHFVGDTEVPAGSFYCFGVGFDLTVPLVGSHSGRTYDIYGRRIYGERGSAGRGATEWYSEGVGLVQYSYLTDPGEMLKLASWEPTPVRNESWGEIKALFR